MNTILVPVDFSDVTEPLVKTVAGLANALNARVILLHVMGNEAVPAVGPEGIPPVGAGAGIALAMPAARDIKQYVNKLESLKARFSGSSFGVETLLDDQEELPARAILEVSRKQKADMIVMGSHGHGALHHLLTGSVTEGVLKAATCPVLVVPSKK